MWQHEILAHLLEGLPLATRQAVWFTYRRNKVVLASRLSRSMDRTKRISFVGSGIARSHSCRRRSVGSWEGHSLLQMSQHVGRTLAYNWSGYDDDMTHARLSQSTASEGPVMPSNQRTDTEADTVNILPTLRAPFICWYLVITVNKFASNTCLFFTRYSNVSSRLSNKAVWR